MPDDPAARLAEIRKRNAQYAKTMRLTDRTIERAVDMSRLLAAVEAALKLADDWSQDNFKGTSALERIHQRCAESLRATITTALTGKETGDGA